MEGMIAFGGVVTALVLGLAVMSRTGIGRAMTEYIKASAGLDDPTRDRLEAMEHELDQVRGALADTQQRLDTAERLFVRSAQPELRG